MTRPRSERAGPELSLHAVTFQQACAFIDAHHRHHKAPARHTFSIGVITGDGNLVGVAIIGRPVARLLDDGLTLEVVRLATAGVDNS